MNMDFLTEQPYFLDAWKENVTAEPEQLFLTDDEGTGIFDTPGFTSFALSDTARDLQPEDLQHLYPEIAARLGQCRYDNCRHVAEPGCAVKQAVEEGQIGKIRYESYLALLKELEEIRKY